MSTVAQPNSSWREQRVRFARWAILCAFGAVIAKLWTMQVLQVDQWTEESLRALTTNSSIPAARGSILDRNGEVLVSNEAQWTACVTLEDTEGYRDNPAPWSVRPAAGAEAKASSARLKEPPEAIVRICKTLATLINASPERTGPKPAKKPVDWEDRLRMLNEYSYAPHKAAPFAADLDHGTVMRIMEQLPAMKGVTVVRQFRRRYNHPQGCSAFHVLGYVQRITKENAYLFKQGYEPADVLGNGGVEGHYEPTLRGTKGREISTPDSPRKLDPPPKPGSDLTLSIDARLQAAAERALARCVEERGGDSGAAIAMDPQSGEVYAMASYPEFRSEWFTPDAPAGSSKEIERISQQRGVVEKKPGGRHPWTNQAIGSQRAPASTFKFVTLTAAIEEGVLDPEHEGVNCEGKTTLGSTPKWCWVKTGHGWVNTTTAIVESCNIFFYRMGARLGEERLVRWTRNFGFGEKTGIDLPYEGKGVVGDRAYVTRVLGEDGWFEGHSANLAIGQGPILATPIQVAVATAMIANGGRRVVPTVVSQLTEAGTPQRPIIRDKDPVTVPIKARTLWYVRNGMRGVIANERGTAHRAFAEKMAVPVAVAGKTGSSEIDSADAWFTCYAPYVYMNPSSVDQVAAANRGPRIVVTVLILNGGHGGDAAAPVGREIIAAAFDERGNFRIRPTPVR